MNDSRFGELVRCLPRYFGGKRRLMPAIMSVMPATRGRTWDLFAGGGSVAVALALRGDSVVAVEANARSAACLDAIQPGKVQPLDRVVASSAPDAWNDLFPKTFATLMYSVWTTNEICAEQRIWLLSRMSNFLWPRGMPGRRGVLKRWSENETVEDEEVPAVLHDRMWVDQEPRVLLEHVLALLERARVLMRGHSFTTINNWNENVLGLIEPGDLVYLDPPYAATTEPQSPYGPLEKLMELDTPRKPRRYCRYASPVGVIETMELVETVRRKKATVVLSYGGPLREDIEHFAQESGGSISRLTISRTVGDDPSLATEILCVWNSGDIDER